MEKLLYLVRHCRANGQAPGAELTEEGERQALALAGFFREKKISHIKASPYTRAIQSIQPTAEQLGISIELEERLIERVLSTDDLPDWMEQLEQSFFDLDMKLQGGESSREAAARGMEVLHQAQPHSIVVTHGNLMALLLTHVDADFGFTGWKELSNPDVYEVQLTESGHAMKRVRLTGE